MAEIFDVNQRPCLFNSLSSGLEVQIGDYYDWFVFFEIFAAQCYAPGVKVALSLRNYWSEQFPFRVVDLGANVGYFTLYIADQLINKKIPFDITCVEGSPRNAQELRLRFHQQPTNQFAGKVSVYNGLVGNCRTGDAPIQLNENHALNHIVKLDQMHDGFVPYLNLDTFVSPERIDLLKIDIEGSEEAFLQEYPDLVKRSTVVILETHETACNVGVCHEILSQSKSLHSIKKTGNVALEVWV